MGRPTDTGRQVTDLELAIINNAVRHTEAKAITDFVDWFMRRGDELFISSNTFDDYRHGQFNDEELEDIKPLRELVGVFGDEKARALFSAIWDATSDPWTADADRSSLPDTTKPKGTNLGLR